MGFLKTTRFVMSRQRHLFVLVFLSFILYIVLSILIMDDPRSTNYKVMEENQQAPAYWYSGSGAQRGAYGVVEKIEHLGQSSHASNRVWFPRKLFKKTVNNTKVNVPLFRVVHLDLKGAPPKISYLLTLLPLLKAAGCNALLIEYEDMFPYSGMLKNISAKNAYTKDDVTELVTAAKKNRMEVIPLVQTFGHLEFVLKLPEFQDLRELAVFPQEICPSNEKAVKLVEVMLRQMSDLHPDSRWIHIGCDEVFHLAGCSKCSHRMKVLNQDDPKAIFLHHVKKVALYVKDELKAIPIVWDDMFRHVSSHALKISGVGELVEPMIWAYTENVDDFVSSSVWQLYSEHFSNVWTASSFKGAFGETLYVPNMLRHLENTESWLRVMSRERESIGNFRGIVLTGWSRYDHFAVLCELLPTSVPSLLLNLLLTSTGGNLKTTFNQFNDVLNCPTTRTQLTIEKLSARPQQWELQVCNYPGNNVLTLLGTYDYLKHEVNAFKEFITEKQGWMTDYNLKNKFSSPWRVVEAMRRHPPLKSAVDELYTHSKVTLSEYFDRHTVKEWIEQKIQPLKKTLSSLEDRAKVLLERESWKRRPLEE